MLLVEFLVPLIFFLIHIKNFRNNNGTFSQNLRDLLLSLGILCAFFLRADNAFMIFVVDVLSYQNTSFSFNSFVHENAVLIVTKIGLYALPSKANASILGLAAIVISYLSKVMESKKDIEETLFLKAAGLPADIVTFKDLRHAYGL